MRGFSLPELAMVITISLSITTIGLPLFSKSRNDARFLAFANELTAQLTLARQYAQVTGQAVNVEFPQHGTLLYRSSAGSDVLASSARLNKQKMQPQLILPERDLPHPTSGRTLTRAFRSSNGRTLVFGSRGSSNATLVFSMGDNRVLSIVIAGQTGRHRAFIWNDNSWQPF